MLNKGILLITFGLVITGYSATFSQEEARRIFGEPSLRSLSFPSVVGDYLFLELSWKEDRLMTLEERESQELEVMLSAIEKFIETNICSYTNSPFCRTLTDWLIVLLKIHLQKVYILRLWPWRLLLYYLSVNLL